MTILSPIRRCVVTVIAALAPSVGPAASYTFEKIHSSLPPNVASGAIAINNDGTVVYHDYPSSGPGLYRDLYIGKAGTAPVNLTNGVKNFTQILIGGLNKSGVVVFIGAADNFYLYTASTATGLTLVASSSDPSPDSFFLSTVGSYPSINDNGDVVYRLNSKIMGYSGGKTRTILDDALFSAGSVASLGNVNSKGVIALLDSNTASLLGVYAVTDNSRVPYAEQATLYRAAFPPSINDSGAIVFTTGTGTDSDRR